MRFVSTLVCAFLAAPLAAQNWYIPDSNAALGTCNVIPFGNTVGSSFYQCKYQMKATQADLGSIAGVISGLGFAACSSGKSHFDSIEIVLDHHPAGVPLSTTFAANLTANAVTVLSATDYTWNITANTWNEIGLQQPFVYYGIDDLVVQITIVNGTSPAGFHRDTRQRVYWIAASGSPPPTGTSGTAASKFEVGMVMARISSYGNGCVGSNGTPTQTTSGVPQLGQILGFDLGGGVPNGLAFLVLGFFNGAPFPLDLGPFGLPGCFQYTDTTALQVTLLDAAGGGSVPFFVPSNTALLLVKLYSQFACIDPAANAAGVTTSNYNRILIGM